MEFLFVEIMVNKRRVWKYRGRRVPQQRFILHSRTRWRAELQP